MKYLLTYDVSMVDLKCTNLHAPCRTFEANRTGSYSYKSMSLAVIAARHTSHASQTRAMHGTDVKKPCVHVTHPHPAQHTLDMIVHETPMYCLLAGSAYLDAK